jgi:hypothetical protein
LGTDLFIRVGQTIVFCGLPALRSGALLAFTFREMMVITGERPGAKYDE